MPLHRPAAVAGRWYPGTSDALRQEVEAYLSKVSATPQGTLRALVAPHAGLVYSGPVAAYAYATLANRSFDAVILVGPSHFIAFDGVAIVERGAFDTPLGSVAIHEDIANALMQETAQIRPLPVAHEREHSLEMQLPFLQVLSPQTPIVPLLMGYQERDTIFELGRALAAVVERWNPLLIASSDLSHYFDAERARRLDHKTIELIERLEPRALMTELENYPEHDRGRFVACGAGPIASVMDAARRSGARDVAILKYANSGDVSGDYDAVVGYLAAAMGDFGSADRTDHAHP